MQPAGVVDVVDEGADLALGVFAAAIGLAVDLLGFERMHEALGLGVVLRRSRAAHAGVDADLAQAQGVVSGRRIARRGRNDGSGPSANRHARLMALTDSAMTTLGALRPAVGGDCRTGGVTTARDAIRLAAGDGLLVITERRRKGFPNPPNVVRIISREWLAWIANRPKVEGASRPRA